MHFWCVIECIVDAAILHILKNIHIHVLPLATAEFCLFHQVLWKMYIAGKFYNTISMFW